MTHTIRAQYDLIAGKEALASDFGAMLDRIEQWDMKPAVMFILVRRSMLYWCVIGSRFVIR